MTRFDTDTALTPEGDGTFTGRIDQGWWIIAGPNGGYVAAILLRAAALTLDDDERLPLVLTTHYLRPPQEGPIRVEVTPIRAGRSVATLRVEAFQDDALLATSLTAFSGVRDLPYEHRELRMPDVPPPAECEEWPPRGDGFIPLSDRYETRWAIGPRPGVDPMSDGLAEMGGWMRTEDAREADHLLLAAYTDAWFPPIFGRFGGPMSGGVAVPTVELGMHFRTRETLPAGAYVLGVFRSRTAAGGYVEEDGELWSEDGVLLAQSRQLSAMVPVSG